MATNECPFKPRRGYVDARTDYLFHFHNIVEDDDDSDDDNHNYKTHTIPTKSLIASTNLHDPLYFWQIYSLIGAEPILELVTDFYRRVFADTDHPWFRDVFVAVAPLGHHINAQTAYWVDAFGGGRWYHGGNYRLTFHHTHNARELMNAKGAQRWMHHMRGALVAAKEGQACFVDDPRILPCIVDFLEAKMRTYAMDHGWKFDETDFVALRDSLSAVKEEKKKEDEKEPVSS